MIDLQQSTDALHLAGRGLMFVKRIGGDRRFVIRELRQIQRTLLGPHNDRRRRLIEMKQRVNVLPTGAYLLDIADLQKLADFETHLTGLDERIDSIRSVELVPAVDTRAEQNLKRAAESVLMDGGRSVEPEINVDIK